MSQKGKGNRENHVPLKDEDKAVVPETPPNEAEDKADDDFDFDDVAIAFLEEEEKDKAKKEVCLPRLSFHVQILMMCCIGTAGP